MAAGATCDVEVSVTGTAGGVVLDNISGDLTSSSGNSGPATASLTVNEHSTQLEATKVAESTTVMSGETATFTMTIRNVGPNSLTDIAVVDPLTPDCVRAVGELEDLDPGEETSYTCTTVPLFMDLTNVATITATLGPPGPAWVTPAGPVSVMTMAMAIVTVIPGVEGIPALSKWGIFALLILLAGTGVIWLRR